MRQREISDEQFEREKAEILDYLYPPPSVWQRFANWCAERWL
jgi:hypothetical protein